MNQTMQKHIRAVELDKILEMLSEQTSGNDAAQLARELLPSTSFAKVQKRLNETDDAYVLMARFGAPRFPA